MKESALLKEVVSQ